MVSGSDVRKLLGIPDKATKFTVDPAVTKEFRVYVQSTSHNRKLVPGTHFVYQAHGAAATNAAPAAVASEPPAKRSRAEPPAAAAAAPAATATPVAAPAAPQSSTKSRKVEIVFSFDATGSMYPCLTQVRREVRTIMTKLFDEIATIRVGVIAHTDYTNFSGPDYVIQKRDLTRDIDELCRFVEQVHGPIGNQGAPQSNKE